MYLKKTDYELITESTDHIRVRIKATGQFITVKREIVRSDRSRQREASTRGLLV